MSIFKESILALTLALSACGHSSENPAAQPAPESSPATTPSGLEAWCQRTDLSDQAKATLSQLTFPDRDCKTMAEYWMGQETLNLQYLYGDNIDITPLAFMTRLKTLSIYDHGGLLNPWFGSLDIGPIATLVNLRELKLTGVTIKGIEAVAHLAQLERLTLDRISHEPLPSFVTLTKLKTLFLNSGDVINLGFLTKSSQLETVGVGALTDGDMGPLKASLGTLRSLKVHSFEGGSYDFSAFKGLDSALEDLEIYDVKAGDLSGLKDFSKLKTIFIGLRNEDKVDLSSLRALTQVETLSINYGTVSDWTFIAGMSGMKKLSITSAKLDDVHFLSGSTQLVDLDLRGNALKDVNPLGTLTELENLDLSYNKLASEAEVNDVLKRLRKLKQVNLDGNLFTRTH